MAGYTTSLSTSDNSSLGSKFLSGTMCALSSMASLELPHINVITKCDLIDTKEKEEGSEDATMGLDSSDKASTDTKEKEAGAGDIADTILDKAKNMVDNLVTTKPKPSEHMIPALARFYTAIPRLAFKKSLDSFTLFVTVFLDKGFEKFGIVFNELEGPEYEKNIDKAKVVARKVATVYKDIFTDPAMLGIIKDMLATYLKFLKEFMKMFMALIKERMMEMVDTGSQVSEKVWIKFGNAVLNAIQSVLPGVGNIMGLIRSIHGVVIGIQEASKEGMDFYLHTQSRIMNIMKRISTPTFDAADKSVDAFETAYKLYKKATKSIDDLANTIENVADSPTPKQPPSDAIANEVEKNMEESKKQIEKEAAEAVK